MRTYNPLLGLSLIALCSCSINFDFGHQQNVTKDITIDATELTAVNVRGHNGSIKIYESNDDQLHVTAHISINARSDEKLLTAVENVEVESETRLDTIYISTNNPDGASGVSTSYIIEAPSGIELNLFSSNGKILVRGDFPTVITETSNGRTSLSGEINNFDIHTSNGSVETDFPADWSGQGKVRTSNGRVTISAKGQIKAEVDADTSNAKIIDNSITGDGHLNLRTSNGRITVN